MTETGVPRICPDAAELAAFAEGRLDAVSREKVGRHLADCIECPGVVAATVDFLRPAAEECDSETASPRHGLRWLIAAAVAAFCIPAALWQISTARDPVRALRRIAADAPARPVEGQLARFRHARFDAPRSSRHSATDARVRAAADRLANEGDGPDVLQGRGIAALLLGRSDEAARLLRMAAQQAPDQAAIWNDLAVAELARARVGAASPQAAAAAAGRAISVDPGLSSAHFNQALALEQLGRRHDALAAFRRALSLESDPAWREEIRARIARMQH